MNLIHRAHLVLALAVATVSFSRAATDPFSENIRPTDALTPEQEEKSFHLPPGFEIHLVAAEPAIGKPVNIAFDDKGRLWVTVTKEYPFPAPPQRPARDRIMVLTLGDDGKPTNITTFAEGLNIPIGIYPYKDGALAYSIPAISFYHDTNNDGKADKVEKFYGDFGYDRDTHGMSSNYVRGFDGWVYGTHGFNNISTVHGTDGQSITMNSGNTYRFRTDGTHIEHFTHGQTNPFGLCFDPVGNLYSADSHSKPIYQLLHDGWYESLAPLNDGLGFAPHMMTHLHGSTAIASVCDYAAEQFPAEFRDNMFVGNVVTSRINRDSITHAGSSPTAHEEPDFLSTDDPWFRPVQIKLGPDGALYVADFYNKIIGHYEVPLTNPGRDHDHGRIWRITYTGNAQHAPLAKRPDFSTASTTDLVAMLNDPNLIVRMYATDQLCDRVGKDAVPALAAIFKGQPKPFEGRHALWALWRLGALEDATLEFAAKLPDAGTRVQALRICTEMPTWSPTAKAVVTAGLSDTDALVRRCAADAIGRHATGDTEQCRQLLTLLNHTSPDDTHLIYVIQEAIKQTLLKPATYGALDQSKLPDFDATTLVNVSLAVPSAESAAFVAKHLTQLTDKSDAQRALRHIAQYATGTELQDLTSTVREHYAFDIDFQLELLASIREGLTRRGVAPTPELRAWALDLATKALRPSEATADDWANFTFIDTPSANPWAWETRYLETGGSIKLLSSITHGESLTGTFRSKPFKIPRKIAFFLAGHTGVPEAPSNYKNFVRLVDADTREILALTYPPRSDIAEHVVWDLSPYTSRHGYIEVVDGDTGGAYAWLAFGKITPANVIPPLPASNPADGQLRQQTACELAATFKLKELIPDLAKVLSFPGATREARGAAATALVACNSTENMPRIGEFLADPTQPASFRENLISALAPADSKPAHDALVMAFRTAPNTLQLKIASALTATPSGSAELLDAIAAGHAPAALLFDPSVKDRLTASNIPDLANRIKLLTRGLKSPDQRIQQAIDARRDLHAHLVGNPQHGEELFTKNCRVCHSLNGQGALIGPQLDGIGNRGIDRLVEDVLDPNRNVDPAFRYSTVTLDDGTVFIGFQRREDEKTLMFVDSAGKEIVVKKSQIQKRTEGKNSLMPANFVDILNPNDFNDVMTFLLTQKAKR